MRGEEREKSFLFDVGGGGGGNCKIVKRHFPAICMVIQPESSVEFSLGLTRVPYVCVYCMCVCVLCLLRIH